MCIYRSALIYVPKIFNGLLTHRLLPIILVIICGVLIATESILVGFSKFSPDSWSYMELAKTIFTDHFYQFNTYRSYIGGDRSGAFPLGYPVILAITHLLFGIHPLSAVVVNICAAIASSLLVINIAKKLGYTSITQATLAISLLLYPGFTDEILSGRSMPAAILCFMAAAKLSMSSKYFLAGLMLGMSVLMRFDFLIYAVFFQIGLIWLFSPKNIKMVALLVFGFTLGLLPWIIYSLTFFGQFWFSDNSWVALSATPAFVLDFPAAATVNLLGNPVQWCSRVAHNLIKMPYILAKYSLGYPVAIIFMCFVFWCHWRLKTPFTNRNFIAIILATLSLMPYVLTGYYDERYFTLFFLVISFVGASQIYTLPPPFSLVSKITLFCMLITVVSALRTFSQDVSNIDTESARMTSEYGFISNLYACQKKHPNVRYIFSGNATGFAAKYGALTGGLSALMPSNFTSMDVSIRETYFLKLSPYKLVDKMSGEYQCNQ